MSAVCPIVPLDLASPYATLIDPKSPTEQSRRGVDWSDWLACNNPGVTLSNAAWAVHPDDDDATLTLSIPQLAAGVSSTQVSGGTIGQSYRLVCTASLSDGQSIPATVQIPVRDPWKQALAA